MIQEKRDCIKRQNVREIWQKYYAHVMTEITQKEKLKVWKAGYFVSKL